jgi:hypothetical protein
MRTITASVQMEEEVLIVGLEGFVPKTNRQSQSDSDSDSELSPLLGGKEKTRRFV